MTEAKKVSTRKAASTKSRAGRSTTKKAATSKIAARKRPAKAAPALDVESALAALAEKAEEVRARLGELTDEGARAAERSLKKAAQATRSTMAELNRSWQKLDPKRKAQVVAGVLGAIAAAAVPMVVAKRKKAKWSKAPTKKSSD